ANDHAELRNTGASDRRHELCAVLCYATGLSAPAHHEAGNVLQEQQGHLRTRAQLDEVRPLQGAFGKQDTVVGEDSEGITADVRKTADQCRAVELLELIQLGGIDEPRNHLA